MNKDLTVGNPQKVLWQFCLPLFGSIIFQQLYNIADSFVAGQFIGETALAAVGNSYEVTWPVAVKSRRPPSRRITPQRTSSPALPVVSRGSTTSGGPMACPRTASGSGWTCRGLAEFTGCR